MVGLLSGYCTTVLVKRAKWQVGDVKEVLSILMLSDVPVGLFLSSGLDSTSIAAGLREMDRPVRAMTVSFPESEFDKAPVAEATARHLRLPHQRIPLGVDNVNKPLLREYLRPRVPSDVLSAPKQGFSLRCLENFDWEGARETIRSGPWVKGGYWDSGWEQLLEPGVPYPEGRTWTLLMLTRWAEAWLK